MKQTILILIAVVALIGTVFADQFGQRQVSGHAYTATGYIKAGCQGLVLITSSDWSGKIGDAVLPVSTVINVPVYPQNTLGDIYFTRSAGTLYTIEAR